jgi:Siphovirus ReqiPepy6 Gp37-like protein
MDLNLEWYTLDSSFRRDTVIEGFESFIWTERYNAWGDFQIVIKSTPTTRGLLLTDRWIAMSGSYRTMKIENIVDTVAEDGVRKMTITGRSMEALFDDRAACQGVGTGQDLTSLPDVFTFGSGIQECIMFLFGQQFVDFINSANDTIPFYHTGSLLPPGSIGLPYAGPEGYMINLEYASFYSIVKQIAEMYDVGFRLVRNGDAGEVYFEVYRGDDRTSKQTDRAPVIFVPNMETLDKTTLVKSTALVKTVAYVYAKLGSLAVYAPGVNTDDAGFKRRVLFVKADEITDAPGATLTARMTQKGLTELAKNRVVYAFDGEIPVSQPYIYQQDYGLGDHVEERDSDGFVNEMIVTEQIFVSDKEGNRGYPTLSLYGITVPNTWSSRPAGEHWADIPLTEHWADE